MESKEMQLGQQFNVDYDFDSDDDGPELKTTESK